ncbi:MAG: hypothetical protein KDC84_02470 [Crocinitomicaceae bacterium]|nr:hypothetical protein [Crocinitomicaceae bacterium]
MPDFVFYLLLVTIPTAAVIVMAYILFKNLFEKDKRNFQLEMKKEREKHFLPLRVEAYQRFVLLMERISPNNLVMRKHNPGMPAKAQQQLFLEEIRKEFDHNIAQQIFISAECWKSVKDAKEETIKIFNIAGSNLPLTATGMEYAQKIFEVTAEVGTLPTEIAVDNLKKEMQRLF